MLEKTLRERRANENLSCHVRRPRMSGRRMSGNLQAFSQTFLEVQFSLGNEGKDGRNLSSQTWPGSPRRPSSRHPRPIFHVGSHQFRGIAPGVAPRIVVFVQGTEKYLPPPPPPPREQEKKLFRRKLWFHPTLRQIWKCWKN